MPEPNEALPAPPQVPRPHWMTGGEANDWPEDNGHENGQYFNQCVCCGSDFIGHKRRHVCHVCHDKAEEHFASLTPDEQKALRQKQADAIREYYAAEDRKKNEP